MYWATSARVSGVEMITHRDALAQLAQAVAVQAVAQFRLAQQDDLQQLAVVGLDVREQAHLFEQFLGQILRLVNDEHGFLAVLDLLEQKFADGRDGFQPVAALDVQAEFRRDGLHQTRRRSTPGSGSARWKTGR